MLALDREEMLRISDALTYLEMALKKNGGEFELYERDELLKIRAKFDFLLEK